MDSCVRFFVWFECLNNCIMVKLSDYILTWLELTPNNTKNPKWIKPIQTEIQLTDLLQWTSKSTARWKRVEMHMRHFHSLMNLASSIDRLYEQWNAESHWFSLSVNQRVALYKKICPEQDQNVPIVSDEYIWISDDDIYLRLTDVITYLVHHFDDWKSSTKNDIHLLTDRIHAEIEAYLAVARLHDSQCAEEVFDVLWCLDFPLEWVYTSWHRRTNQTIQACWLDYIATNDVISSKHTKSIEQFGEWGSNNNSGVSTRLLRLQSLESQKQAIWYVKYLAYFDYEFASRIFWFQTQESRMKRAKKEYAKNPGAYTYNIDVFNERVYSGIRRLRDSTTWNLFIWSHHKTILIILAHAIVKITWWKISLQQAYYLLETTSYLKPKNWHMSVIISDDDALPTIISNARFTKKKKTTISVA